jgi:pyruvate formate lyase activating enzyme
MRGDSFGIAGWAKNSFIDFPGTVSTVLFFSGCNLRCPYCHNPGIVLHESEETIPLKEILIFLKKRKGMIEGVVFSGGEPTIHETLESIVSKIRSIGYKIKLDTNGLLPEKIQKIKPDYLALDVKTTPTNYTRLLKSSYENVKERLKESISIAISMKENAEIRITIAPGIIDNKIIEDIWPMLQGVRKVYLQPMQTRAELLDPEMKKNAPISQEEIKHFREMLSPYVGKCEIR